MLVRKGHFSSQKFYAISQLSSGDKTRDLRPRISRQAFKKYLFALISVPNMIYEIAANSEKWRAQVRVPGETKCQSSLF